MLVVSNVNPSVIWFEISVTKLNIFVNEKNLTLIDYLFNTILLDVFHNKSSLV